MRTLSKRHGKIIAILERDGTATITDLARELNVSAETIRRDIRPLSARGTLARMHGAVGLPSHQGEAPFQRRMSENAEAKQAIARAAARSIGNGDSLAIDTGTTTSFLARALVRHERLSIVTNSTDVARTLSGRGDNRVYLLGGKVNGDSGAILGSDPVLSVARFRVDHAVISAGALTPDGIMDFDPEEAEFARAVLKVARRRVVIADSTKFHREALILVCALSQMDELITEIAPAGPLAQALAAESVKLSVTV